ncbi:hypothetical protein AVEN_258891-1 [Araneus ventricosus]|uniref:Uncharacterized protein n=1 Tax=Araneus ventricosus TaxID=182803 RepID=A0A4Y1ZW00_ARAVE|nr:hypothetical protein AVEN_258891-1 [Araneus ventricosus]
MNKVTQGRLPADIPNPVHVYEGSMPLLKYCILPACGMSMCLPHRCWSSLTLPRLANWTVFKPHDIFKMAGRENCMVHSADILTMILFCKRFAQKRTLSMYLRDGKFLRWRHYFSLYHFTHCHDRMIRLPL